MRILRYTLFLFAIGLISCEQEFDKKEQQSDCCSFQNLPKYPEQVVNINVHNYIPDMGDKVLSSPSHISCDFPSYLSFPHGLLEMKRGYSSCPVIFYIQKVNAQS